MSVSIDQETPRIIRVELTGHMDPDQWRASLAEVANLLVPGAVTPLLIYAPTFEGWAAGEWDDFAFQYSFQKEHDPLIGRMAIIADKRWEDQAMLFAGQGFRALEIEFFTPGQLVRARRWLTKGLPA